MPAHEGSEGGIDMASREMEKPLRLWAAVLQYSDFASGGESGPQLRQWRGRGEPGWATQNRVRSLVAATHGAGGESAESTAAYMPAR